jgi:hypothetical protein
MRNEGCELAAGGEKLHWTDIKTREVIFLTRAGVSRRLSIEVLSRQNSVPWTCRDTTPQFHVKIRNMNRSEQMPTSCLTHVCLPKQRCVQLQVVDPIA